MEFSAPAGLGLVNRPACYCGYSGGDHCACSFEGDPLDQFLERHCAYAHANYLVFPRPLPSEGSKVIGIKYDLVEEPAPRDAVPFAELERAPKTRERSGRKSQTSAEKKPVEKIFHLAARTVAVIETKLELKARNRNDAKSKAHELVKGQGFDPAQARFTTRIKILGDR